MIVELHYFFNIFLYYYYGCCEQTVCIRMREKVVHDRETKVILRNDKLKIECNFGYILIANCCCKNLVLLPIIYPKSDPIVYRP